MSLGNKRRVLGCSAFLLHQRAYSETSLLLDIFSRDYGRVTAIAKGVKSKKSKTRGILIPFQPLFIAWSGKGDVKTVTNTEIFGPRKVLHRKRLFCAYYLNELVLRTLHRGEPHEKLFDAYDLALDGLVHESDIERTLRIFEKWLLQELGYGLQLSMNNGGGGDIEPKTQYRYTSDSGLIKDNGSSNKGIQIHGESLQALQTETYFSSLHRRELKRLTRTALDRHLEGRRINSRDLFVSMFIA